MDCHEARLIGWDDELSRLGCHGEGAGGLSPSRLDAEVHCGLHLLSTHTGAITTEQASTLHAVKFIELDTEGSWASVWNTHAARARRDGAMVFFMCSVGPSTLWR